MWDESAVPIQACTIPNMKYKNTLSYFPCSLHVIPVHNSVVIIGWKILVNTIVHILYNCMKYKFVLLLTSISKLIQASISSIVLRKLLIVTFIVNWCTNRYDYDKFCQTSVQKQYYFSLNNKFRNVLIVE